MITNIRPYVGNVIVTNGYVTLLVTMLVMIVKTPLLWVISSFCHIPSFIKLGMTKENDTTNRKMIKKFYITYFYKVSKSKIKNEKVSKLMLFVVTTRKKKVFD